MSDTSPLPALSVSPASAANAHEIQRERKRYLTVYAVLIAGTALTVAMYYVHFDEVWQAVAVALLIATVKVACVGAIFMHLWHGPRDLYALLSFTGLFVAAMLGFFVYSVFSLPGSGHYLR